MVYSRQLIYKTFKRQGSSVDLVVIYFQNDFLEKEMVIFR